MQSVVARKGVPQARRCDICRAPYRGLPRSLRIRESPAQAVRRQAAALLDSPAGVVASYYAAGGLVFSVALALHGAWQRLATLHAVVAAMQQQPAQALRLLAPDLALAVLSEACLSGHWAVPLQSAARIVQGLVLRLGAAWAEERAASALPGLLLPLPLAACMLVRVAGNLIQYTNTGLVLLFGGLARGFARGALLSIQAPVRLAVTTALTTWRGLAGLASLLPLRRRRQRQRQRPLQAIGGSDGSSGLTEQRLDVAEA